MSILALLPISFNYKKPRLQTLWFQKNHTNNKPPTKEEIHINVNVGQCELKSLFQYFLYNVIHSYIFHDT